MNFSKRVMILSVLTVISSGCSSEVSKPSTQDILYSKQNILGSKADVIENSALASKHSSVKETQPQNNETQESEISQKSALKSLIDYNDYDFSQLLINRDDSVIGILGGNYKRLIMKIETAERMTETKYSINGSSQVIGNITPFIGDLTLKEIQKVNVIDYGIDDEYRDKGVVEQGTVIFSYEIKENPNKKYSGLFQGIMQLKYYKTEDNKLHYDNIRLASDGYFNRLYQGTWRGYNSNNIKNASWADFSLPNKIAPNLNIGAGEFVPNPDYYQYGWEGF